VIRNKALISLTHLLAVLTAPELNDTLETCAWTYKGTAPIFSSACSNLYAATKNCKRWGKAQEKAYQDWQESIEGDSQNLLAENYSKIPGFGNIDDYRPDIATMANQLNLKGFERTLQGQSSSLSMVRDRLDYYL
jgi:hypothetical protein